MRVGVDISQEEISENPQLLNAVLQGRVKLVGGVAPKKDLKKIPHETHMGADAVQMGAMGLGGGLGWHFGEKLKMFKKAPSVGGSLLSVPAGILAAGLAKKIL